MMRQRRAFHTVFTARSTPPTGSPPVCGANARLPKSRLRAKRAGCRSWSAVPDYIFVRCSRGWRRRRRSRPRLSARRALHVEIGAAAFHDRLRAVDAEAGVKLDSADTQRVLRAYEVAVETGRTLGDWQRAQARDREFAARAIVLVPPREALYPACDARFLAMMAGGVVEEVTALAARGL